MCVKCDESEKDCRQIRKKKFNVGTVVMEIPKGDYIPKGDEFDSYSYVLKET